MNYKHTYMRIISHAKSEQLNGLRPSSKSNRNSFKEKYEFHHILPKSLFPLWEKRSDNLVALTLREHYFVHLLLTKIYPSYEMAVAMLIMANKSNIASSREYERIRLECSLRANGKFKGINNLTGEKAKYLTYTTKTCEKCGKPFNTISTKEGLARRFCSRSCANGKKKYTNGIIVIRRNICPEGFWEVKPNKDLSSSKTIENKVNITKDDNKIRKVPWYLTISENGFMNCICCGKSVDLRNRKKETVLKNMRVFCGYSCRNKYMNSSKEIGWSSLDSERRHQSDESKEKISNALKAYYEGYEGYKVLQ